MGLVEAPDPTWPQRCVAAAPLLLQPPAPAAPPLAADASTQATAAAAPAGGLTPSGLPAEWRGVFATPATDFDAFLLLRKEALPTADQALLPPPATSAGGAPRRRGSTTAAASSAPQLAALLLPPGAAVRDLLGAGAGGPSALDAPPSGPDALSPALEDWEAGPPPKRARAFLRAFPEKLVAARGAARLQPELLVGFDPVARLLGELGSSFGHLATFCADGLGGRLVGVRWAPEAFLPQPLRLNSAHTALPLRLTAGAGAGKGGEAGLCVPNVFAVLAEVREAGLGLVEDELGLVEDELMPPSLSPVSAPSCSVALAVEPLVIDPASELTEPERHALQTRFEERRAADEAPALYICTPQARVFKHWWVPGRNAAPAVPHCSACAFLLLLLLLMVLLLQPSASAPPPLAADASTQATAAAAPAGGLTPSGLPAEWRGVFATPATDFDAFLLLRKEALPTADQALLPPPATTAGGAPRRRGSTTAAASSAPQLAALLLPPGAAVRDLLGAGAGGPSALDAPPSGPDALSPALEDWEAGPRPKRARAFLRAFPEKLVAARGAARLQPELLVGFDPVARLLGELGSSLGHLATFDMCKEGMN
ncbi:Nucleolar protein 6 [Tetrabaena socialis]|uniref:Nucleolar protein 6 n=1 Tax=Tetrabaena socialis TaxID=47790 RepID=A0A2J7ZKZ0_9CHLO|nr:Nucleolar protein 6 [Tetrabaena socialis]|eukprot:PNH00938.1 Nucleolar protein 6 [Tetrabaena socialis]